MKEEIPWEVKYFTKKNEKPTTLVVGWIARV